MKQGRHCLPVCFILLAVLGIGANMATLPDSTALSLSIAEREGGYGLDVPFVPASKEMMGEMLRMATITKDDLVYNLGCGDGRMVVAVAKRYGAKAVGIDANPERIRESRQNATKAGIADRVKFVQGNLFDADISQATVIMLYLLPGVNRQLRPKLLKELKPGARIVSHDFNMGNWKPDAVSRIEGGSVYRWVVPANVSGTWVWNLPAKEEGTGTERYVAWFIQKFQETSGGATVAGSRIPVNKASISGDRIRFSLERCEDGRKMPMVFEGRVDGDIIRGKAYPGGKSVGAAIPWEAARKAMTIARTEE